MSEKEKVNKKPKVAMVMYRAVFDKTVCDLHKTFRLAFRCIIESRLNVIFMALYKAHTLLLTTKSTVIFLYFSKTT